MLEEIEDHKNFKTALKKLRAINPVKWRSVGSGGYGVAYDMKDGRVCKITYNRNEYLTATKIRGKRTKYIYKVLSTFKIKRGIYLIITPKYQQLNRTQHNELFELVDTITFSRIKKLTAKQLNNYVEKEINCLYRDFPKAKRVRALLRVKKSVKKYKILNMLKELKRFNIKPRDIHEGNILKNKNLFVLIDLDY